MSDRNQQNSHGPLEDELTGPGFGKQGIDKAPGEETSTHLENVVADTQKGKNKVDGDPSKESDQPIKQDNIDD